MSKAPRGFKEMMNRYSDSSRILIYQMGKVGSTAIEESLGNAINVHTLYGQPPCKPLSEALSKTPWGWARYQLPYFFRRRAIQKRNEINVICLVRDPVARNRSMFFQDLYHWLDYYVKKHKPSVKTEGIGFLLDAYQKAFEHDYCENWFDSEVKRFCGVDIFSKPFTPGKPAIQKKGKAKLFVCRLEDLSQCWTQLETFCDRKLEQQQTNSGAAKWYRQPYAEFNSVADEMKIDSHLYDSRFAKHFGYFSSKESS